MSGDKNHSEELKKYLKGEMTPQEANAFERQTLNDPFAQEALEGLEIQNTDQALSTIADLQKQVDSRSKKRFGWMRIAAVVSLLFVSAFALWFSVDLTENTNELAIKENQNLVEGKDSVQADKPIRETKELIAEVEQEENSYAKTFKEDEVQEVDKIELDDEEIEEAEVESIMALTETELYVEKITEETEISPIEISFEETDDVQIAEAIPQALEMNEINAEKLDSNLLAQSLAVSDQSEESDPAIETLSFSKRKMGSQARSASSSVPTISGKVTGDSGETLPGVNVLIKGTTTGTQTDLDGNYSLPRMNDGMILIYSFVGFESQAIEVGNRTSLDVSMGGATELQEVVVTAVGVLGQESIPNFSPAKPEIGNRKYTKYLKENLQYPTEAINNEIEGTVVLDLTISPRREITFIDIKKSLGYGCDEEAIRLIKEGPGWEAAKRDGIASEGTVKVKVKFKMDR